MPIQGLTNQRRLPRMGKIRLGLKVVNQNGREYPKAVDYFVCPPEVQEVFGPKPTALDIILPVDAEELVASTFYKAYSASRGLVCRGDGITANRLIDSGQKTVEADTGVITGPIARSDAQSTEWAVGIACPGRDCPYYEGKQCRELMSLQFMLHTVPGLGVWQLDTSSYHSIVNIYSGMELIRSIFGSVAMIPLTLSLEPIAVSPEGEKKTVHVLHLRSNGTLAQIAERRTQPLVPSLMPAPDEEREEVLFPENEYEPVAPAEDQPKQTIEHKGPTQPAAARKPGRCEVHDRPWAKMPDGRLGHPVDGEEPCYQDASTPPSPPEQQDSLPDGPEKGSVGALRAKLEALGWTWDEFQSRVLNASWQEFEALGSNPRIAWSRFQRHNQEEGRSDDDAGDNPDC